MTKKYFILIGIILLIGILFFVFSSKKTSSFENVNNFDEEIIIYKSSTCGCCELYADYFKRNGNSNVKIISAENIEGIKKKYGVPSQVESCHTVIIGDYFVEGHVPLEAIEKLLQEKPDIKGIGIPGMPSGSPGMPGGKKESFVIYAVNNDGSTYEFMRM